MAVKAQQIRLFVFKKDTTATAKGLKESLERACGYAILQKIHLQWPSQNSDVNLTEIKQTALHTDNFWY